MPRATLARLAPLPLLLLALEAPAEDAVVRLGTGDAFRVEDVRGAERLRVEGSGNVGIGTATPGSRLTVNGTVESSSGGFRFPDGSVQASAAAGGANLTVLTNNCTSLASFDGSFSQITTFGSFTKLRAGSQVEVTYNGRIAVTGGVSGTGARFELRVDGQPTTLGWARAAFKASEVGLDGVPVSITGVFPGLAAGSHSVSMWVATTQGTGANAFLDPGCWSSDHIVIREY